MIRKYIYWKKALGNTQNWLMSLLENFVLMLVVNMFSFLLDLKWTDSPHPFINFILSSLISALVLTIFINWQQTKQLFKK